MDFLLPNITEILILLFIIITFLQSGLDKVFDWKGQISWLNGHFKDTFLGSIVPLLVAVLVVLDLLASVLAGIGIYQLAVQDNSTIALYGSIVAAITLLMLLFGQRIAKDYAGAFTIVGYFIVVIFGVWLLSNH
ncbi:DoxX family protein [uncultured Dokdonia sp.]|uniref:DoxX family protein n=1 Tax=uncultured Dokdonia sp. TaxID=575653 RepID=UPI002603FABF|nr:DoxX family protein [uncultured Dokdonia sp.]